MLKGKPTLQWPHGTFGLYKVRFKCFPASGSEMYYSNTHANDKQIFSCSPYLSTSSNCLDFNPSSEHTVSYIWIIHYFQLLLPRSFSPLQHWMFVVRHIPSRVQDTRSHHVSILQNKDSFLLLRMAWLALCKLVWKRLKSIMVFLRPQNQLHGHFFIYIKSILCFFVSIKISNHAMYYKWHVLHYKSLFQMLSHLNTNRYFWPPPVFCCLPVCCWGAYLCTFHLQNTLFSWNDGDNLYVQ